MQLRKLFLLFAILYMGGSVQAQFTRFRHLSTDQGLSGVIVYAIAQDRNGFIWTGNESGICKFDGYKVSALSDSGKAAFGVSCLLSGNDDKLWIGYFKDGMACLDLRTLTFTYFRHDTADANSLASDFVKEIIELDANKLAITTSKGLNIYDRSARTFSLLTSSEKDANSLLSNNTRSVEKMKDGSLWISHHGKGLTHYFPSSGKFERVTAGESKRQLGGTSVRDLLLDRDGLLWISLWNAGINVMDTKTGIIYRQTDTASILKHLNPLGLVFDIYEDSEGYIWFASAEDGLIRFNKKTGGKIKLQHNPDDPESIGDNTVMSILEDKTGVIWAGTWRSGLNYFDKRSLFFGYYKHQSNAPNTLVNNHVTSVLEEDPDRILLGTGASIAVFHPSTKTFSSFYMNESARESLHPNSPVSALAKDRDGSLWIGSSGGGIYHYDPDRKKYRNYTPRPDSNSVGGDIVEKVIVDHEGQVWVSFFNGPLSLYNRERDQWSRLKHLPPSEMNLASTKITDMVIDPQGMIWIGTEGSGVIKLNPSTRRFSAVYNKSQNTSQGLGIASLFADRSGFIWIGSSEGLLKLNPHTELAENYAGMHPALSKTIIDMVEDLEGNLWLLTKEDVIRYHPRTNASASYHISDGLQGKEFYGSGSALLSNGYLLLGGLNGFNYFNPQDIVENKSPPQITFTDFNVLNKPYQLPMHISCAKEIALSYRDYFFSLSFAAMDFSSPGQNQFRYKLEGFNDEWVDNGNVNSITFTNLDPGDYVLKVQAANSNGVWNETGLELKIRIDPPFWRTTWFYVLCILVTALLIYAYIKWREKRLVQEKTKLEQKVQERTEELHIEKLKVEEAHKDIKDSIYYARKIQSAVLPSEEELKRLLPASFILYKPKDIVSGDFYWLSAQKEHIFFALADCTGHGVPGGFMTMLGSGLLNELVNEQKLADPAEILNRLRDKIIHSLKQTGKSGENKDGMDIVLLKLNPESRELEYAAANNVFMIVNHSSITEYRGEKQPVGIYGHEQSPFTTHKARLEPGDVIYCYTDGFPDQFGGPKGKKYKYKPLNELLSSIADLKMEEQKQKLEEAFETWRGSLEQVDDVCLAGIRV